MEKMQLAVVPAAGETPMIALAAADAQVARIFAAALPAALAQARPGSREFRLALREALKKVGNLPAAYGVFNMSAGDHLGFDQRARVMVKVEGGAWKLVK